MIEFSKPKQRPVGLKEAIKALPLGQLMVVWFEDYERSSVAHAASMAGREIGGKYSVHIDWDKKRYIINRTQ